MGNKMVSSDAKPAEEKSTDSYASSSSSSESLDVPFNADNIIIDLDAPEYNEYLKHKRSFSRSEGNLNEFSYLKWMKTNNVGGSQTNLLSESYQGNNHMKVTRRRSAPVTGNEINETKKSSEEYEKRATDSKERINKMKKKYNLKDRDYNARTYVWNSEDEKKVQREREEGKNRRKEIRAKYNLPTPSIRITTAAQG
ncbi:uncharacterized protein [Montipora foliosa]|uniref:uncharacterized protein n=1 Tax=Montipora foliosa TaxID=591990 RepID=UPI0035F1917F